MLKLSLIIIISYLFQIINTGRYTCQFGHIYHDRPTQTNLNDKPDQLIQSINNGRLLQAPTRAAIRITLDTTNFNTIEVPIHGETKTTTTNLNFIKKAMLVTEHFYQSRLKVSTIARVFAPSLCSDFNPSSNDVTNGISSSDLHIYVRHTTDNTKGYGATAVGCKWVTSRSLPDPTLQQGRPTVGRIIFNTFQVIDRQGTLTNRLFAEITATALHQTMHILGFDYSRYSTYLDSTTNNVYASVTTQQTLHASRQAAHYLMTTPNVKAWARAHYDCVTLAGMALENQDGSTPGSHWQRTAIYDQLMTGTQLGAQKGFTALTFALLKDMGWYQVDDTFNDTVNFGYHKQCSFFNDACYGATYDKYFCNPANYINVSACSTTFLGKAICTDQNTLLADGCGMFAQYMPCVDPDQSGDSYKPYTLQKYKTNSFCVLSTFANVGISETYRSRCYPYLCGTNQVTFTVGTYTVSCADTQAGVRKTINSLYGYLQCPNFIEFCTESRKICKNWCSGNGFCTRGVCNCYKGYYGQDCTRASCVTGEYWDQSTATCVTDCPSRTYQNLYSKACQYCSGCDQCRDEPEICTGCLSTPANPLFFYAPDSSCLSQCPITTYKAGDFCIDCQATPAQCSTCSQAPTNCTSCQSPSSGPKYFLQNPNYGSCVTTCTTPNTIYNIVDFQCTDGCTDNLKYYPGTDPCADCPAGYIGFCDLCPVGQFKLISDQTCNTQCPSKYYEDSARRFCDSCHVSCFQCDGSFAQNCTQCSSTSQLKYLLLKMCVSSCPRGFYPNEVNKACQICPINLNCATCQIDTGSGSVVCLTCKYEYFLQPDQTCQQTCPQYYYKNKWNHTCDQCSPDCGDCTTSADSSCSNCRAPKMFLANQSGGFCLTACPTQQYTQSGQNCLQCYSTCLRCNGVSSQNCLSCKQTYFLSTGLCRYVCPAGTYQNQQTKTCNPCDGSCTFCFGKSIDNCTSCVSGLVLDNFTCAGNCSNDLTVNQWGVCYQFKQYIGKLLIIMMIGLLGII